MSRGPDVVVAQEGDLPALRSMFEALYAHMEAGSGHAMIADDGFERWCAGYGRAAGRSRLVVVARDGGRPVGFAEGTMRIPPAPAPAARVGHVAHLFVDAAGRRGGTGSALHGALRAWFAERGATEETVDTAAGNAMAEAFWASRGFASAYTQHRLTGGETP